MISNWVNKFYGLFFKKRPSSWLNRFLEWSFQRTANKQNRNKK